MGRNSRGNADKEHHHVVLTRDRMMRVERGSTDPRMDSLGLVMM